MPKIAAHAKSAHGMTTVPDDVMAKIKAAIKEI
jgi:predicted small metal-binding protein